VTLFLSHWKIKTGKRKYVYKKNIKNGQQNELLGNKTKNMPIDSYEYNSLKHSKKKATEHESKVMHSYSNFSVLTSYDNRDIYHDFYKIANLNSNTEDKKK